MMRIVGLKRFNQHFFGSSITSNVSFVHSQFLLAQVRNVDLFQISSFKRKFSTRQTEVGLSLTPLFFSSTLQQKICSFSTVSEKKTTTKKKRKPTPPKSSTKSSSSKSKISKSQTSLDSEESGDVPQPSMSNLGDSLGFRKLMEEYQKKVPSGEDDPFSTIDPNTLGEKFDNVASIQSFFKANPSLAKNMPSNLEKEFEEVEDIDEATIQEFFQEYQENMAALEEGEMKTGCCGNIHQALDSGHLICSKYFMENSPELQGENLVCLASISSNPSVLQQLLQDPAVDINGLGPEGQNALHFAALHGGLETVKFLVEKGVDYNKLDNGDCNPLFYAAKRDESEVAEYLIDLGSQPYCKGAEGETPIHTLAGNNHYKLVIFIIFF